MTELAIRCSTCGTLARVPRQAAGRLAICPGCRGQILIPEDRPPSNMDRPALSVDRPAVSAAATRLPAGGGESRTVPPQASEPDIPIVYPVRPVEPPTRGLLYGLAISAFLVPLAWLLLRTLGVGPPVFTLGLPLAIAFAAAGLGFGVAMVNHWSFAFRIKVILTLLLLAWGLAAFGYFLKASWVESVRRDFNLQAGPWRDFHADGFEVKMPGLPRLGQEELIRGWGLMTYRFAEGGDRSLVLTVGHGRPAAAQTTDDQFFDAARAGALAAAGGQLVAERSMQLQGQPGREFIIRLWDNATNRTLRVYRVGTRAVVAVAEGPFLTPDARDAARFFNSLKLRVGR